MHPFDGFSVGGLVPCVRNLEMVLGILAAVREEIGDRPLHVFGLGKPETTKLLFEHGVDSVDSSSYAKLAAEGRSWSNPNQVLNDPTPDEHTVEIRVSGQHNPNSSSNLVTVDGQQKLLFFALKERHVSSLFCDCFELSKDFSVDGRATRDFFV